MLCPTEPSHPSAGGLCILTRGGWNVIPEIKGGLLRFEHRSFQCVFLTCLYGSSVGAAQRHCTQVMEQRRSPTATLPAPWCLTIRF